MAQRDLNLNSFGKYAKNSADLLLEVHGSCEVPAGCGGVVLRWRNPDTGLLFIIRMFAAAKFELFIDGAKPSSGRPLVAFGDHVLSIALSEVTPGNGVIAFAAVHDESQFGFPRVSRPSGRKIEILSAADGTWKYATTPPAPDAWMLRELDDSNWQPMPVHAPPVLDKGDMRRWQLEEALKSGAHCLGVDGSGQQAWIRKRFTVSRSDAK